MTSIKPRNGLRDDIPDSRQVADFIRESMVALSRTPYDPATGALPLRTDVFYWAADYLAGRGGQGVLIAGGLDRPTLTLQPDGTATIRFVLGLRSLTLHVLCKRVVRFVRTFEDGQTTIEGYLPGHPDGDLDTLGALVEWLDDGGGTCD